MPDYLEFDYHFKLPTVRGLEGALQAAWSQAESQTRHAWRASGAGRTPKKPGPDAVRRQVIWDAILTGFSGARQLAAQMGDDIAGAWPTKKFFNAVAAHPRLKLGSCAHLDVALYKLARWQLFAGGWTRDKFSLISPDSTLTINITTARYHARAWRILFITKPWHLIQSLVSEAGITPKWPRSAQDIAFLEKPASDKQFFAKHYSSLQLPASTYHVAFSELPPSLRERIS